MFLSRKQNSYVLEITPLVELLSANAANEQVDQSIIISDALWYRHQISFLVTVASEGFRKKFLLKSFRMCQEEPSDKNSNIVGRGHLNWTDHCCICIGTNLSEDQCYYIVRLGITENPLKENL